MEHSDCGACCRETESRPPNRAFLALIVAFWLASVALGFLSAAAGWGLVLAASWAALATSVVLFARRATSGTCVECGSMVTPPVPAPAQPMAAAYPGVRARHA